MARPSAAQPPTPLKPADVPFWTRSRIGLVVLALLAIHLGLAVRSLIRENPTIDEVVHLPAGVSYWEQGTFRLYHHNPPLIKLVAAWPVVLSRPTTAPLYESSYWRDEPPNKAAFAHEFARLNAGRYFELFIRARLVMPLFSVLGGLVVFAWSSRLYGSWGGLLSLALWSFCPNILAHARLVTTDLGATALGVLATFFFWLYLRKPTWGWATLAGLGLGLAQLSKFSMVLFYGLWPLLGLIHLLTPSDRKGRAGRVARGFAQGAWMLALSVVVIDAGYGFEGVGLPLGRFEFVSRALTCPAPAGLARPVGSDRLLNGAWRFRVNRFRGTILETLPVPLPRHYVLGFDAQKLEAEGIPKKFIDWNLEGSEGDEIVGYSVYLDGVLRQQSWWSYYLFALAYKVPEGTWLLVVLSMAVLAFSPLSRAPWFDELAVLAVPVVVFVAISVFTNINLGLRYVLPIFPYLFISAGKLVPWAAGLAGRGRMVASAVLVLGVSATASATLWIHPHYLAYFNAVSGGPARGSSHLIDSNLDWGQDLVGLKRWLDQHAAGERVGIAYFGQINPNLFALRGDRLDWFLPPPLPGTMPVLPPRHRGDPSRNRLKPGLYAVSASLVRGLPWQVYDNGRQWAPWEARQDAFGYFRELTPIDQVGYSIFLYRVTVEDAARLAWHWTGTNS